MAEIPAIVFLLVWFGMQFSNGFLSIEVARRTQDARIVDSADVSGSRWMHQTHALESRDD